MLLGTIVALVAGFVVSNISAGAATVPTIEKVEIAVGESTFTNALAPTVNYGSTPYLIASAQSYRSFLRFDTSKIPSAKVLVSAALSITTTSLDAKTGGVQLFSAPDTWASKTLTAKNRPAPVTALIGPLVLPAIGKTTLHGITDLASVKLGGKTSIEVGYSANNSNFGFSKVGVGAPKLILTLQSTQPPAPPPTTSSTTVGTTTATTPPPAPTTTATTTPPTTPPTTLPPVAVPAPLPVGSGSAAVNTTDPATHKKLVFAHYFPPFPISLENAPPVSDYYTRNYLKASGENGAFASVGGLLRDRPVPRDPLSGNWKLQDMKTEVANAKNAGIDGFIVDILSLSGMNWEATVNLIAAAEQTPGFKIMLEPDMTTSAGRSEPAVLAAALARLAKSPSVYRTPAGEVVVAPFKGEGQTPSWWSQVIDIMARQHGIKVAFMPIFLNPGANMDRFASISYGFGDWGVRNPASIANGPNYAAKAHSLGKKWFSPIAVQDVRPNQKLYDEAGNTESLRAGWARAINDGADFAQLITWNDYSETTSFAPSTAHGYTFLDINQYYMTQFQTGVVPKIVRDAVYVTHRNQAFGLAPTTGHQVMKPWPGTTRTQPRNTVEILTLLTAPANVTVKVGGTVYTYAAPAGAFTATYPLGIGEISASAQRNGTGVAAVTSPYKVKGSTAVQDLQYFGSSSLRPTPRQN